MRKIVKLFPLFFLYSCIPENKKSVVSSFDVLEHSVIIIENMNKNSMNNIIRNACKYDKFNMCESHKYDINSLTKIETDFLDELKVNELTKEKLYNSVVKTRAEFNVYEKRIFGKNLSFEKSNIFKDSIYISDNKLEQMILLSRIEMQLMLSNYISLLATRIPLDYDPCK